jgi:hypothetical protein
MEVIREDVFWDNVDEYDPDILTYVRYHFDALSNGFPNVCNNHAPLVS